MKTQLLLAVCDGVFAAIPDSEIASACERFGIALETWQRQELAFGLMKKVYAKRAKIRGQQQPTPIRPARRNNLMSRRQIQMARSISIDVIAERRGIFKAKHSGYFLVLP